MAPDLAMASWRRLRDSCGWKFVGLLPRLVALTSLGISGYALGAVSAVDGLYAGAGTGYLQEEDGSEAVSDLTVYGSADDWSNCHSNRCDSVARWINVTWSVSGSSTFAGIEGASGGGNELCYGAHDYLLVDAGPYPANPTGSATIYLNSWCSIGEGVYWDWFGGMCDTESKCVYLPAWGPNISWVWSAPGGSAFLFQYRW